MLRLVKANNPNGYMSHYFAQPPNSYILFDKPYANSQQYDAWDDHVAENRGINQTSSLGSFTALNRNGMQDKSYQEESSLGESGEYVVEASPSSDAETFFSGI